MCTSSIPQAFPLPLFNSQFAILVTHQDNYQNLIMADASTSSSNEQSKFSSKRRRQLAKPVAPDLIFNLPANDFMRLVVMSAGLGSKLTCCSKIELFSGPQVKVEVEGESFKLPKNLLCHYSSYFRAAFEGQFKEMQCVVCVVS